VQRAYGSEVREMRGGGKMQKKKEKRHTGVV